MSTAVLTATLPELHDPATGRIDAARVAAYLHVPLTQLAAALGKKYPTVYKTPAAPSLQAGLAPIKRSLEILEQVIVDRPTILAWLNSPHPDLGMRTPMCVILEGHGDALETILENALMGIPS